MTVMPRCSQAVPALAAARTAAAAGTDVAKTHFAKIVTGYEARRCRARAVSARILGRHCGSGRADVYDVLPRGVRNRAPGSLTESYEK